MSYSSKEIKSKYHYKNIYMQVLNGFENGLNITNACNIAKVSKNQYYTACRKLEKEPLTKIKKKSKKKTQKGGNTANITLSEEVRIVNDIELTESKDETRKLREKINEKYNKLLNK